MPRRSGTLNVVDRFVAFGIDAHPDGSGIWVDGHGKITVTRAREILAELVEWFEAEP